uniref:Secreted protein n=1 Tax=Achlya hypogyna TaxID=1202772 RepID=A0A0A7CLP2_ACHHY|nr:secreted protein [Achlya hypogyna]
MRTVLALSAVAVASTAAVEQCSPAALQAAVTPVALSAGAALLKCSEESGLSLDAVADPSTASPAQVEALLKSDSCASFFASVQSAIAKISPPCALVTSPSVVTSAQISDLSFKAYLSAGGSGSAATAAPAPATNATTVAPSTDSSAAPATTAGATSAAPSTAAATTAAPAKSSARAVASTFAALTVFVALAML